LARLVSANHVYGVAELDDMDDLTGFIADVDAMVEIDAPVLHALAHHFTDFADGIFLRSLHVREISPLTVEDFGIVMQIEKIARHSG
jgi:hypothetical protein